MPAPAVRFDAAVLTQPPKPVSHERTDQLPIADWNRERLRSEYSRTTAPMNATTAVTSAQPTLTTSFPLNQSVLTAKHQANSSGDAATHNPKAYDSFETAANRLSFGACQQIPDTEERASRFADRSVENLSRIYRKY